MPRRVSCHQSLMGAREPPLLMAPVTPCPCAFQGKVHLELRLSEVITDSGAICHKLATR